MPLPYDLAPHVITEDLNILACASCGHMQSAQPNGSTQKAIYETYYSHYQVDSAEALLPHYRQPFKQFLDKHLSKQPGVRDNRSILEIGCSSGVNIDFFTEFAARYVGIDASERIKLAQASHPDHEFVAGYFPETMPDGKFDIIVSQFNLEHIGDIGSFLSACRSKATPDGQLILQVPDIDDFERSGQPNFLAHEHLQYFRKNQLAIALRRNGWSPFAWDTLGASLICGCQCSTSIPDLSGNSEGRRQLPQSFATRFNSTPEIPDRPLILYGVGPLLFWIMQHVKPEQTRHVLDDNPAYAGLFVPGTTWPVEVLSASMLRETPDIVLSLNSMYHDRVLARIRAFGISASITRCKDSVWETFTI